eukprot:2101841-Rhodomonas_salina.1
MRQKPLGSHNLETANSRGSKHRRVAQKELRTSHLVVEWSLIRLDQGQQRGVGWSGPRFIYRRFSAMKKRKTRAALSFCLFVSVCTGFATRVQAGYRWGKS